MNMQLFYKDLVPVVIFFFWPLSKFFWGRVLTWFLSDTFVRIQRKGPTLVSGGAQVLTSPELREHLAA